MLKPGIARPLLLATAAIAALALLARAWLGPYRFGVSVQSPMNGESILALALTVLLWLGARGLRKEMPPRGMTIEDAWLAVGLGAACLLASLPSLRVGFVADDYAHILNVSRAGPGFFADQFTVPAADRFFRPLGMLSYWLDFQWAAFSEFRWHLAGIVYHVVNTLLLFALLRLLQMEPAPSWAGAAMFGLHGSRPEAVTWVSARFDLIATLFVLLAAVAFVLYARRGGPAFAASALAASLCALLSKESAYVLPLLLAAMLLFDPALRNTRSVRLTGAVGSLMLAVFAYRWWLLRGIGGYQDATGEPTIFRLNPWLFIKALALRLWAVLYFPLNWTDAFAPILLIAMTAAVFVWLFLALRHRADRPMLQLGIVWTLIAALPVYHLLLIDSDLEKSRVIYLSSAGFGLFTAAVLANTGRWRAVAAAALLLFQTLALHHNLATWDRASRVHAQACSDLAAAMKLRPGPAIAVDMPNVFDGVYMLNTGLPACLEIWHGIPESSLTVVPTVADARALDPWRDVYMWDKKTARIVPAGQ